MDQTVSVPGAYFSPGLGKSGLEVAFLLLVAALRFQSLPPQGFYRSLQVLRTLGTSDSGDTRKVARSEEACPKAPLRWLHPVLA